MPVCRLPEAYRRLPRLSSPLNAKTSTVHPYQLGHIYRSPSSPDGLVGFDGLPSISRPLRGGTPEVDLHRATFRRTGAQNMLFRQKHTSVILNLAIHLSKSSRITEPLGGRLHFRFGDTLIRPVHTGPSGYKAARESTPPVCHRQRGISRNSRSRPPMSPSAFPLTRTRLC